MRNEKKKVCVWGGGSQANSNKTHQRKMQDASHKHSAAAHALAMSILAQQRQVLTTSPVLRLGNTMHRIKPHKILQHLRVTSLATAARMGTTAISQQPTQIAGKYRREFLKLNGAPGSREENPKFTWKLTWRDKSRD